jgi:hypothetical protein
MLDRAFINVIELIIGLAPITQHSTAITSTNLFPVWIALGIDFSLNHPYFENLAKHIDSRQKLPVRAKTCFLVPSRCIDNYLQDLATDTFHLAPSARYAIMGLFEVIIMDCVETFCQLFSDPSFSIVYIDYHLTTTVQCM